MVEGSAGETTFEDDLEALGFARQGESRRGGVLWQLQFNRYLRFAVHDHGEELLFSWVFDLGEFLLTQGMQVGAGETSFQELYPRNDVRLAVDADAVRAEITRTLGRLRFDLGAPSL